MMKEESMKKFIIILIALFTIVGSVFSMSYEHARSQALFLTDKMAYELNLTEEQYEAAFEVNLDYLMSINTTDDLFGTYWTHRNLDLSYILLDWQYRSFIEASYFYKPLWWDAGYWYLSVYARYPRRDYFYFGRPRIYAVYRGGHRWRMNEGRSWYSGRRYVSYNNRGRYLGMRDNYQRGMYRQGYQNINNYIPQTDRTRSFGNQQERNFGNNTNKSFDDTPRRSSTRTTVSRGANRFGNDTGINSFGGSRSFGGSSTRPTPNRSFTPSRNSDRPFNIPGRGFGSSFNGNSRFGGHR